MNAIFRHLSVRLWMTVPAGGLILLVLMPLWQRLTVMAWIPLPVFGVMAGSFMLIGWLMNRWGMALIERQISEAVVWERAGMASQAEAAFERAKSVFDSFWLSPLQRHRAAPGVARRLARFHLAQPVLGRHGYAMVSAYLLMKPDDEEVAQGWLEALLCRENHQRSDHAVAERLGSALDHHPKVQRLLMQFYLANGRSDFEALQTYRRVWRHSATLNDTLVASLARVLLNENYLNDWALQVYLRCHAMGGADCLDGIAASVQLLRPNDDNRTDLEAARAVLAGLDDDRRRKLTRRIQSSAPPAAPEAVRESTKAPVADRWQLARWPASAGPALRRVRATAMQRLETFRQRMGQSARLRRAAAATLIVATVGVVTAVGWQTLNRRQEAPAPPPEPVAEVVVPPPVTDPFTIQVAAYLRPEDAQRYVDRLKGQNVDAFWTKAASGNRTWYQVKVSHFPTRDQARQYGELLKTKGLIDDFYVANYIP